MNRKKYPLRSGEYKLKEALYMLRMYIKELKRIADYKQARNTLARKAKGHALQRCTPEDMDKWLKELPQHIAHTLSYYVIPATSALTGDGVPEAKVEKLHAEAVRRSDDLVHRLGSVWAGNSLDSIIADTVALIESVLNNAAPFMNTDEQCLHS
jgi:hypothetical protein